jgi:hypothetical protein
MPVIDKRAFPRMSTVMPLEVRRLPPTEMEDRTCRISTDLIVIDDAPLPPVENERLNLWLNMINTKLDYLIRTVPSKKEIVVSVGIEPLNISGNGMSLATKEEFSLGDVLEIRIVLQTYPSKVLHLYGEVVRVDRAPDISDTHILGIKFLGMSDAVRDEILKFDFKKHRQRLMHGIPVRSHD